jgi:hypothetical protein
MPLFAFAAAYPIVFAILSSLAVAPVGPLVRAEDSAIWRQNAHR